MSSLRKIGVPLSEARKRVNGGSPPPPTQSLLHGFCSHLRHLCSYTITEGRGEGGRKRPLMTYAVKCSFIGTSLGCGNVGERSAQHRLHYADIANIPQTPQLQATRARWPCCVFIIDWLMMAANASCGAKFMHSCSPVAKGRELARLTVGLRDVSGVRRSRSIEGGR